MNKLEVQVKPTRVHIEKMESVLVGYWESDCWDVRLCPVLNKIWTRNYVYLKFDYISNPHLKREVKFFIAKRLTEYSWSVESAWRGSIIKHLMNFIENKHSHISSFMDVPKDILLKEYKSFLYKKGKPLRKKGDKINSDWVRFFLTLYDFLFHFYDEREETEKDIWDVSKLNIDYNEASSIRLLNFEQVPSAFKELLKSYIKERLMVHQSLGWGSVHNYVSQLTRFFTFISKSYPNWKDIEMLSRQDILDYIAFLRSTPMGGTSANKTLYSKQPPSDHYIYICIQKLQTFIIHLQRFEWSEAPAIPISKLVFSEDMPNITLSRRNSNVIKYIPDEVWEQVVSNIDQLPSKYMPILIILEASGFRISDVVSLKLDCLLQKDDGYWLVGDQTKVKYKSHKVPISKEVAKTIKAQQELVLKESTIKTNPNNYLFPTLSGLRVGKPTAPLSLSRNLNAFAAKHDITDKNGNLFYFNNHAFRHRYGVNLINNGMKLLHVQKLMAHASPEMTLVYAQIHDNTLRKEWEKSRESGAIRLDVQGDVVQADLKQQAEENGLELEWIRHNMDSIRLDHGFCVKSPKLNCDFLNQTIEPPCIKNNCRSFHVDQTFLPYYKEQIAKIESDIKIYKKTGRTRSIEIIQPKLKRYQEIVDGLKRGDGIFGLDKGRREYVGKDREELTQNGQ
ncbi:tyrosine-type recombinase/integrase [Oceanobacillus sojae]|uniref:tyrosine-type recombinase/integrase n=1 Tax=Oceanobacillus sojae TaxID=582851 RepID=UPI0036D32B4E